MTDVASTDIIPPARAAVRPSRLGYLLGLAVVVVGVGASTAFLITTTLTYQSQVEAFQRVDVPGERSIRFDHTGMYTVYGELPSSSAQGSVLQPAVTVTDASGAPVDISMAENQTTLSDYSYQLDYGFALGTFEVASPGAYTVTTQSGGATEVAGGGEVDRIAITQTVPVSPRPTIIASLGVAALSVLLGILVVIVVFLRRRRSRRRRSAPAAYPATA
jgi:hypothetical protein